MTVAQRWVRFNLVGIAGAGVQLGLLAFISRVLHGHSMAATAIALELTLLHNFAWHQRFTWKDRSAQISIVASMARFHLSNGLVSATGNLLLMYVLVEIEHFPPVLSNAAAIVVLSVVNFALASRWAFAPAQPAAATPGRSSPIAT